MKILIAEDELSIAKGIESILQLHTLHKHNIVLAENGLKALEIAKEFNPDLVISDIRMYHMDGLEFVENLKKHIVDCKIIIISGYENFEYAQRSLRAGAMDYLLKPIDKQRLLELVDQVTEELKERLNDKYPSADSRFQHKNDFFKLEFDKQGYPESLKKIVAFIKKKYTQDISLQILSEELMLHPNYISALINKHFEVSLNHILNYIRLEKACELLSTTDMSIAEISYLVGYNNERRIYNAFRKYLNSSPGDFRKSSSLLV